MLRPVDHRRSGDDGARGSAPPVFAGKIRRGAIPSPRRNFGNRAGITLTALPVLPVLSGRDQVPPTSLQKRNHRPRERRYAREYHAIMATAWSISAVIARMVGWAYFAAAMRGHSSICTLPTSL